jgi:GTPase involved in cell partitioning and DNA repair
MTDRALGSPMFQTVLDHDERIVALEKADKHHDERLKKLEDNAMKLENTVMTESRDTRTNMIEQVEKLFAIVENARGYQTARTAQSHELRMAKINMWSTVFLRVSGGIVGLLPSGGAINYVLQHVLTK